MQREPFLKNALLTTPGITILSFPVFAKMQPVKRQLLR